MENTVRIYIADRETLAISPREVARYLGYSREALALPPDDAIEEAIRKARGLCAGKACYGRYPVSFFGEDGINMPYGEVHSRDLRRNLDGCGEVYIFAATIGAALDREMARARLKGMSEPALLQAAGAAAVEAVCDEVNALLEKEAAEEGRSLRRRFSPGYGDLGLENQKGVFELLNPAKHIGLTLMDTLIMSPEKSVTAIIGIAEKDGGSGK
ncbi:MAG: Vitamin B12 dependent methionine synthase activation subunit [Lachnospiraceae bacterium]|nr:Vitamin B12 dependent methionine synthase activation subunit [Lachnospiraceae bacterium]